MIVDICYGKLSVYDSGSKKKYLLQPMLKTRATMTSISVGHTVSMQKSNIKKKDVFTYIMEHPLRDFFFFFSLSLVGGWITTLMAASNTALTFYISVKYFNV